MDSEYLGGGGRIVSVTWFKLTFNLPSLTTHFRPDLICLVCFFLNKHVFACVIVPMSERVKLKLKSKTEIQQTSECFSRLLQHEGDNSVDVKCVRRELGEY